MKTKKNIVPLQTRIWLLVIICKVFKKLGRFRS
nr:MAG TPA: hypothetical protein [Caudoviricetes sp.]